MLVTDLPVHHKIITKLESRNFTELTEIQEKSMLPAIQGKDIIASSKTGSGKTLAFLIPAINRLMSQKALSRQDPRALILAPTRELAKQVFIEAKTMCTGLNLACTLVVGGENYNDQVKALRRNPHIIVGTAGRVADHLKDKSVFLNGLELLIFDEADRMLDLGFSEQLNMINEFANHRKRQTMLFSATLDSIELNYMTARLTKAAVRVSVGDSTAHHGDIQQQCFFADNIEHKDALLHHEISNRTYNQAIVFTATREDTDRLTTMLNKDKLEAIALRGDLPQNQRAAIMSEFARGQHSVLVTTDVASRGLDLSKVGLVINFDLPKNADEYIHRIGRTGRAGQKGEAASFVGPRDWKSFIALKAHLQYELECEAHEALPAKFKGIKAPTPKQDTQKNKAGKQDGAEAAVAKKVRRVDTMAGTEIGMAPVKRKPRKVELEPEDDTEFESGVNLDDSVDTDLDNSDKNS
ncbi:DEAD/DEAH box helicase [Alteromonas stellipolaris]|uniref:DEAD/DEAH box helicase n=1 Tax=Alteromonas stellipolaris TaxID=233316 RepID=UPI001E00AA9E|nr:DEAD/DEAH box helicase [Alteromonas stellipolaris]MBZ2162331.1 DEAD/DEAH box helicase [Alteromonas stellipolaris]